MKNYIETHESVPGNWDSTCCLVSTDVTIFFKTTLLTSVENHTKADLMFLCQHTVLPQYLVVNCRSNNKNYNAHSRTTTKEVLRNVGRYEVKVL